MPIPVIPPKTYGPRTAVALATTDERPPSPGGALPIIRLAKGVRAS